MMILKRGKIFLSTIALTIGLGLQACSPTEKSIEPDKEPTETISDAQAKADETLNLDHVNPLRPTRFTVEIYGEIAEQSASGKPQIILLPGLASSPDVWDATREQLEATHEVHVLHVNGFAGSDVGQNSEPGSLFEIAKQVSAYASALEKPSIIGHSMGGLVALMVASQEEAPVSKVMSVDVLPFFSVLINPMATEKNMKPAAVEARDKMLAQSDDEFADSQKAAMKRLTLSDEDAAIAAQWSISSDRAAVANIMYDVMLTDLRKDVSKISVPTTVVYAFDQATGFPKNAVAGAYQINYAALQNVDLRMIENARHYLMMDQPEAFAAEVSRFVAE
ncbi:alpha/beta fold hydrolase [Hirschia baltica]|nr:alpha/beta hydrolase [Hirschia baltica]